MRACRERSTDYEEDGWVATLPESTHCCRRQRAGGFGFCGESGRKGSVRFSPHEGVRGRWILKMETGMRCAGAPQRGQVAQPERPAPNH